MPHLNEIKDITNENKDAIFKLLKENDIHTKYIRINDWDIPEEVDGAFSNDWNEFITILRTNTQLLLIDLSYSNITTRHIISLLEALLANANSPITSLDFSDLNIEVEVIEIITELIKRKPLINLDLIDINVCKDNQLSERLINALNDFFEAIKESATLKSLDIQGNSFLTVYEAHNKRLFDEQGDVCYGIVNMLLGNNVLKKLFVANSFNDMHVINYLVTQGFSKSSLQELDIDISSYVIDGRSKDADKVNRQEILSAQQSLALAFRNLVGSSNLRILSILHPYYMIADDDFNYPNEFCKSIMLGICKESKLKQLSLNWNLNAAEDILSLARALTENESLQELELQAITYNEENPEVIATLTQALLQNKKLRSLRFIRNKALSFNLAYTLILSSVNLHKLEISIDEKADKTHYTLQEILPLISAYLYNPSIYQLEIRFAYDSIDEEIAIQFQSSLEEINTFRTNVRQNLLQAGIIPLPFCMALPDPTDTTLTTTVPHLLYLPPPPVNYSTSSSPSAAASRSATPDPRQDARSSPASLLFTSPSPVPRATTPTSMFSAFAKVFVDEYWQVYNDNISPDQPVTEEYKAAVRTPFVNLVADIFTKNFNVSSFNPEIIIDELKKISGGEFFIISPEHITITPNKAIHRFSIETMKAFKNLILEMFSKCINLTPSSLNSGRKLVIG